MRLRFLLSVLVLLMSFGLQGQAQDKGIQNIGLSTQVYPAGVMINAHAAWSLNDKSLLMAKLGYNIAERKDYGEHDQEDGGGPGVSLGYKRYFKTGYEGLYLSGRLSSWFLDIDWRDDNPLRAGNTDITVLQPTIALGYDFLLKGDQIKLGIFAAAGYEINVITSGEKVGQGGISIGGASVNFRLK